MTVVPLSKVRSKFAPESVKQEFPIFVDNDLTTDLAYLDNAATTQKPNQVLNAINEATTKYHAPVNRGFYALAEYSSDAYEKARHRVAQFIGASDSNSVIFTASATDSINQITQIYFAHTIQPKQTIWVSRMEHHANYLPWQALASQKGALLKVIELTPEGELDLDLHPDLFSSNSAVIAITDTSNVLGVRNDIKSITAKAQQYDIPVVVDAAQATVSNKLDVTDLECDFLVFSGHKMFAPNGIGIMYISPNRLKDCQPTRLGGGMVDFVSENYADTIWSEAPHCYEAGSPNLPGAVGLAAACDFIDTIGQEQIKAHISTLAHYLYDNLQTFKDIKLVTPEKHIANGLISFYHSVIHAHDLAQILGDNQVAVRAGHHCAQPLLDYLNTSSTLRISISIYNTIKDIDKAIDALHKAEEIFC